MLNGAPQQNFFPLANNKLAQIKIHSSHKLGPCHWSLVMKVEMQVVILCYPKLGPSDWIKNVT